MQRGSWRQWLGWQRVTSLLSCTSALWGACWLPSQISGALAARGHLCNNPGLPAWQEHQGLWGQTGNTQLWAGLVEGPQDRGVTTPVHSLSLPAAADTAERWEGHGAAVTRHRSPIADEPCSVGQALYLRGFIAPYCATPPGPAQPFPRVLLARLVLCRHIKSPRSACEKLPRLHYPAVSIRRTCENQAPHQKIIKGILRAEERRLKKPV